MSDRRRFSEIKLHQCLSEERRKFATILYRPPVVYDLSEPAVLAVDQLGVVFPS